MILPDVLNTMLMGMIFMVVLVTVVRPLVLNAVGNPVYSNSEQDAMLEAVRLELERVAYEEENKRANQIRYQHLLLELTARLQPKPLPEPEPEPEPEVSASEMNTDEVPQMDDGVPQAEQTLDADGQPIKSDTTVGDNVPGDAAEGEGAQGALAEGEIEIREGETLAEIKERMKKEQKNAKKPTIPPELLNNAKSYEDKVGVVRMVVHQDQSRVAAVIRSMIQTK